MLVLSHDYSRVLICGEKSATGNINYTHKNLRRIIIAFAEQKMSTTQFILINIQNKL